VPKCFAAGVADVAVVADVADVVVVDCKGVTVDAVDEVRMWCQDIHRQMVAAVVEGYCFVMVGY